MKRRKMWSILALTAFTGSLLVGCQEAKTEEQTKETNQEEKPVELLIAAAASLEYSYEEELIPMFEKENPDITVKGTYDSSGKLQTQIEEGIAADVFYVSGNQTDACTFGAGTGRNRFCGESSSESDRIDHCRRFRSGFAGICRYHKSGCDRNRGPRKRSGGAVFQRSADESWNLGQCVGKSQSWNECDRSFEMGRGRKRRCGNRVCNRCSNNGSGKSSSRGTEGTWQNRQSIRLE